jgi:hypothetical protein
MAAQMKKEDDLIAVASKSAAGNQRWPRMPWQSYQHSFPVEHVIRDGSLRQRLPEHAEHPAGASLRGREGLEHITRTIFPIFLILEMNNPLGEWSRPQCPLRNALEHMDK